MFQNSLNHSTAVFGPSPTRCTTHSTSIRFYLASSSFCRHPSGGRCVLHIIPSPIINRLLCFFEYPAKCSAVPTSLKLYGVFIRMNTDQMSVIMHPFATTTYKYVCLFSQQKKWLLHHVFLIQVPAISLLLPDSGRSSKVIGGAAFISFHFLEAAVSLYLQPPL